MNVTGHSLGGGLASAASSASGSDAYTFNAAGLNAGTLQRYGAADQNPNIAAYHVKGEVLTGAQSTLPLPEARGTSIELPAYAKPHLSTGALIGTLLGGPVGGLGVATLSAAVDNHLMPAVNNGVHSVLEQSEANLRKLL